MLIEVSMLPILATRLPRPVLSARRLKLLKEYILEGRLTSVLCSRCADVMYETSTAEENAGMRVLRCSSCLWWEWRFA
jgi:hypothetical protein